MDADSYKRMNGDLSHRREVLFPKKECFAKAGDNFMKERAFGVSRVAHLGVASANASSELKRHILGSIFPERLIYEEKKISNHENDEVVDLLWNVQADCEETKTGRAIATNHLSCLAPRVGLEPTTLRLTAACSTIELSRNGIIISTHKIYPKRCGKSRQNRRLNDENRCFFVQFRFLDTPSIFIYINS